MEKEGKRKKLRRVKENNESCEKRSPLQNLNGHSNLKPISKKTSNLSSSSSSPSAPVSGKLAPRSCLRFLLSSNSCSSYSSSSSSSTTHLDKKSKIFPKSANNEPNKSAADVSKLRHISKENEIPRKPFPHKSKRNPPQTLTQRQNGESKRNPIYKNVQRSKLSSVQNNRVTKLKQGMEKFGAKVKNPQENGACVRPFELIGVANNSSLNCAENFTPMGKVASGSGLQSAVENSKDERVNDNSATAVKTPPVEASLSPNIQNQSHSKVLVLKSAATPICYGAGHLISGVTDKRKCRRRGSLKGGCEKVNLFDDERNVTNDLQDPSIPLLAEASVRWLLSPCKEGHEDWGSDSKNKVDECRMVCDIASGTLDGIISSPSTLCGNASDFVCSSSRYSGIGSIGNMLNERGNRNKDEFLLASSPYASGIGLREGEQFGNDLIGDNSTLSTGSLSSENIIQTPNSDSRTDVYVGTSRLEQTHGDFVVSELDLIRETLDTVKLSPRSEMSMWDPPGLGFHFADISSSPPPHSYNGINRLQDNIGSVSSWVSDATLDNLALSQMKISWQDDELATGIVETTTDELDCCCCLSDEEIIDAGGFVEDKNAYLSGQRSNMGVENKENGPSTNNDDLSPMILDYEPRISARRKEESLLHNNRSIYAESISTDGGGLIASDESNWTYCCHENHLFQVK